MPGGLISRGGGLISGILRYLYWLIISNLWIDGINLGCVQSAFSLDMLGPARGGMSCDTVTS